MALHLFISTSRTGTRREAVPVRCSDCFHALKLRQLPEVVDCSVFAKLKNADVFRVCPSFQVSE